MDMFYDFLIRVQQQNYPCHNYTQILLESSTDYFIHITTFMLQIKKCIEVVTLYINSSEHHTF